MGCKQCGCTTPRSRLCKQCDQFEHATLPSEIEWSNEPNCPECSGITSGEGVVCYKCR